MGCCNQLHSVQAMQHICSHFVEISIVRCAEWSELPGAGACTLTGCLGTGDNIVDIHATSRGRPGLRDSNLDLSLSQGFIYERNTAKRFMEDVRKVCFVLTVWASLQSAADASLLAQAFPM